jgi:FtsP/CotA-like multicopper oxidase with cupredoxin domain
VVRGHVDCMSKRARLTWLIVTSWLPACSNADMHASPHDAQTQAGAVSVTAGAPGGPSTPIATQPATPASTPTETQPATLASMPASNTAFDVTPAVDLDPRADVVEVHLEAKPADIELSPGHVVHMWTYNGVFPGPRIEAHVGDRLRVTLKNSLAEPTTIHWHGLRVPSQMDGVEAVQRPIAPGEEFSYEFDLPDAGTFWYHPHVHSDEQVERGLYGPIVVRASNEPTTTSDHVVVLDDILLDSSWQIAPFGANPMQAMLGREGNVVLANGRAHPVVDVAPGGLQRFRFINAANARYFRLVLPGHKLIQIGSEAGLLAQPRTLDEFLLVPGQRADFVVATAADEQTSTWQTEPYQRGHHLDAGSAAALFDQRPVGAPVDPPALPSALGTIEALPPATVNRELRFGESMGMMGGAGMHHASSVGASSGSSMGPVFSFNGEVFPNVTPLKAHLGDVEEWSLVNTTPMDHPFHLHGFRFQVVSSSGEPPAWRDTVNVPAAQTLRIRLRLDDHPGTWMFHCHILEHAERGMMGELQVDAQ